VIFLYLYMNSLIDIATWLARARASPDAEAAKLEGTDRIAQIIITIYFYTFACHPF